MLHGVDSSDESRSMQVPGDLTKPFWEDGQFYSLLSDTRGGSFSRLAEATCVTDETEARYFNSYVLKIKL